MRLDIITTCRRALAATLSASASTQAIGAKIDPGWQLLAGHLAFLFVLAVRPEGFFPRVQA